MKLTNNIGLFHLPTSNVKIYIKSIFHDWLITYRPGNNVWTQVSPPLCYITLHDNNLSNFTHLSLSLTPSLSLSFFTSLFFKTMKKTVGKFLYKHDECPDYFDFFFFLNFAKLLINILRDILHHCIFQFCLSKLL